MKVVGGVFVPFRAPLQYNYLKSLIFVITWFAGLLLYALFVYQIEGCAKPSPERILQKQFTKYYRLYGIS
jgi:uncharacterized membrane protein